MEQQLYAFALSGRLHGGTRCTQGVALGYELHGLSARTCTAWLSDEHGKCNGHGGPCPSNHGKCNGHGGRAHPITANAMDMGGGRAHPITANAMGMGAVPIQSWQMQWAWGPCPSNHGKCNGHGGPCPSNHGKCNGHGGPCPSNHGKCNGHGGPYLSNHGKCNGHGGRNRTVGCALKGQQSHSPGQRPGITYRINNRPERAKARWHTPLSNDITKTTTG